jgi:hypothetical protein
MHACCCLELTLPLPQLESWRSEVLHYDEHFQNFIVVEAKARND